jgi:hypothetical protein
MNEPKRKMGPNALQMAGTIDAWYFCFVLVGSNSTLPEVFLKEAFGPCVLKIKILCHDLLWISYDYFLFSKPQL